ncbi:galectin-3-like [Ambystoma mexicanum]|uniref:galectin-3-like n=1 Tax=Ambystoma mexicanum TaxID=8296 RepID=UPI0037E88FB4
MADEFSLADAVTGVSHPTNTQGANPEQPPSWSPNPWGQYPGAPGGGQQYPGFPPAGQPYPGYPGAVPTYPGMPAPGQPYPGPPANGQQFPGAPGAGQPFPLFPGAGQTFPGFSGPSPTPTGPSAPQPSAPSGPQPGGPAMPLKVPFELPLPSGMMPRLLITIQGSPNKNCHRFTLDFKRKHDIALHYNVRFDENPKVIVRNSMINDRWGQEERQAPKFPFEIGKPFQIQCLCERDCFKFAVNGEHLLQFNHRMKELNEVTALSIHGDVTLTSCAPTMV